MGGVGYDDRGIIGDECPVSCKFLYGSEHAARREQTRRRDRGWGVEQGAAFSLHTRTQIEHDATPTLVRLYNLSNSQTFFRHTALGHTSSFDSQES